MNHLFVLMIIINTDILKKVAKLKKILNIKDIKKDILYYLLLIKMVLSIIKLSMVL